MDANKELRRHLLELLEGKSAHIDLETVLNEFPIGEINTRLENAPHTAWELLEHLRIAQHDIVEFSRDANHVSPKFPDGYWNKREAVAEDWKKSVKQIYDDLQTMRDLVSDEKTDLLAKIPHGDGQTVFREALLVADHNTYHLGQIAFLMRILEKK
ncbi:MAG: DinB family protein [Acidobacteriota bacterium]|nr:DinB family protein [Acidobacteriota bacterium]